ncbi:homeodomain-interacting protein kinase 1-like [Xiphias gladius]|uniref:homeodomain-interacting protein kinase 1-like n=1 Tax=Xiphias gladius TaxID=8245 RepID=UPI001A9A0981|nr:homeodomain-interacting protein kinase 1-like [Xiphias gladius]
MKNVVHFFEQFQHKGHTCLVFEMLDRSLLQLLSEQQGTPLSLHEIRPITHQLLMALDALKGIGVVHSDLKPDNIMLANHLSEPFRIKLIDFGVSFSVREEVFGKTIQPLGYRAPEVTLGLPFSEAIDAWSLGCVLGVLYLCKHLFAIDCEYQSMRGIVDVLGQPADHLLCAGKCTQNFFKVEKHLDSPRWWMKTPREYQLDTGIEPKTWDTTIRSLDDLITHNPDTRESIELEDQRAFVSLLTCLLDTDPEKRITPGKALDHPFVTMVHLEDEIDTSFYVEDSLEKMRILPMDNMDLFLDCAAEEEPKEEEPSAIPRHTDAGSVLPGSCDGIKNMPQSSEGAEAAAGIDTTGSAIKEPTVSQGATSPAEDASASGGSPDESLPAKVKKSPLKRVRKFFGRAIRTILRLKKVNK